MKAVVYYITLPFLYLIAIMPLWLLYRVSDILFFLSYYVIRYRRKIVFNNLKNSFPDKSGDELKKIERRFYRYFCDLIVETLKTLTISSSTLRKRVDFEGLDIFQKHFDNKQSLVIVMGHFGNWEIGGARFAAEPLHKLYVIYHPLHNKYFNQLIVKMRTRLGNGLYPMKETVRGMVSNRKNITATAFIADQSPAPENAHWMEFLNQDTPVFTGPGKIAQKFKYPVVYISILRPKRGKYRIVVEELVSDPNELTEIEIAEKFNHRLERDIQAHPEIWLWTHRRWKHKRE